MLIVTVRIYQYGREYRIRLASVDKSETYPLSMSQTLASAVTSYILMY